jgi:WD40 repeat protein
MGNGKSAPKKVENHKKDMQLSFTDQNLNSLSHNDVNSAPNYTYTLTSNIVVARNLNQSLLMGEKYKKKRVTPKITKNCQSAIMCIVHLVDYHKNLFATGHEDGIIYLWDINTFNDFKILKGHAMNYKIRSLIHLSHVDNNMLLSCSEDKTIKIWNIHNGSLIRTIIATSNIITMEHAKDFNPNIVLTGHAFDYSIYMWDFTKDESNEQLLYTFNGHLNNVWCFLYIPEVNKNYILSAGEDCTIILWDLELKSYIKIFDEHTGLITSMAYLGGGKFASAALDGNIKLWDVNLYHSIKTITPGTTPLFSVKSLSNIVKESLLIVSSDGALVLVNYNTQKVVKNIKTDYFMAPLTAVVNHSRYSFMSCNFTGEILQLWDLE